MSYRLFVVLCFTFLGALSQPAWAQRAFRVKPIDHIVAVVNNDIITSNELNDRMRLVESQLQSQKIQVPPRDVLEKQILERMINERVQLQFASETGIRVDETTLDNAIQRIAAGNQMPVEQLRQALERDGVSFSKFRGEIRNEILLARIKEREADNKVVVTDSELESYFASQAHKGGDTEYNLAHILVQVPEQASPEQIQQRKKVAENALAEIKRGADFGQVSAQFSDAPNALQGGVLGWRPASRLPQLFLDALNALQPGEISHSLLHHVPVI